MKQLLLFFIETISFLDICMFAFSVLSATVLVTVCLMDIQKKNTTIYKVLWGIMIASVFFIFAWGYPFYKTNNSLIVLVGWIPLACTVPVVHIIMTYRKHKHKTIRGFVSSWARNGFETPEIVLDLFAEMYNAVIAPILLERTNLIENKYMLSSDLRFIEVNKLLSEYEISKNEEVLEEFFEKIVYFRLNIQTFGVSKKILDSRKK